MDSSCLTYRVGKVQSIFSLPVTKSYSVIPLFRIPRFTDSQHYTYVLQVPFLALPNCPETIKVGDL